MKYNEFIQKFNEITSNIRDSNEVARYHAHEDKGMVYIGYRGYILAKLIVDSKYWDFSEYSSFTADQLKVMAELADTEPKFRCDTLWVLINGKPYITESGLVCYQYFRKSKYGWYLENHLATSYEMFKKLAPYDTFELEKLKEKCAPDLGRAIEWLKVELDKVENIDEVEAKE